MEEPVNQQEQPASTEPRRYGRKKNEKPKDVTPKDPAAAFYGKPADAELKR